jgi:hypothetical protein
MAEKEPKFDKNHPFSEWAVEYMYQYYLQSEEDETVFESKYAYKRVYHHMNVLENHPEMHNPDSESKSLDFLLDEMKKGTVPEVWVERIQDLRFEYYLRVMNDEAGRYSTYLKLKTLRHLKKAVKKQQVPEKRRAAVEESIERYHNGCLLIILDWISLLDYLK